MSNITSLFHIVISTKNRTPALLTQHREELFSYLVGIARNKSCEIHAINGIEDHLHILMSLNAMQPLSAIVKELKRCSSIWMSNSGKFPLFDGWVKEYAAFSCSASHKQAVIDYIRNQEIHHKSFDGKAELERLISRNSF